MTPNPKFTKVAQHTNAMLAKPRPGIKRKDPLDVAIDKATAEVGTKDNK
jgi:hypothetical protein